MATVNTPSGSVYGPDMEGATHEGTYKGFVKFVEVGSAIVICWVLALAVGGVRHAWMSAIFGVVLSIIAGTIGAFVPTIAWRAPAAVAVLLALMLLLY
jgi:hypothetical protein